MLERKLQIAGVQNLIQEVSDIGSRASQVTLPGVGHWHMLEAPEKCIEIIKSIC